MSIQLQLSPSQIWSMSFGDYNGIWKTMNGDFDKRVYQFELDNINKLKEWYNTKQSVDGKSSK